MQKKIEISNETTRIESMTQIYESHIKIRSPPTKLRKLYNPKKTVLTLPKP